MLAAAFLQAGVAAAAPGDDAFTIDGTTFDPTTAAGGEGFDLLPSFNTNPPLLSLGLLSFSPSAFAGQNFDVYSGAGSSATDLGSINTINETVANLAGFANTEFTVGNVFPATGTDASALPATGTVYDVLNLGGGTYNVYVATPDVTAADGTVTSGTVTDTLVTPSGNTDLSSLFGNINAANPLQPGDAFTGLQAGDSDIGKDAFTLGGYTFDPNTFFPAGGTGSLTTEGYVAPLHSLATVAPLLQISGGFANISGFQLVIDPQYFDVYSGTGSNATQLGTIYTGEAVTNLLGLPNTEFTVVSVTPATGTDASALPAVGTVYDVLNLGNGYQNVYIATPDVGSTSGTVTDTLVTPNGDINLDSLFGGINAANPLDAGAAFTGLQAGDSAIGADAFTIGSNTFDPFTGAGASAAEGFAPVSSTFGAAPLLNLGGGTIDYVGPTYLAPQDFDVYSGTGSEVGSITTGVNVGNLLGLANTEFTVASVTPTGDATDADLPAVGSVYNVLNLGSGWENIYIATPGSSGTVTDTLVTPFGNVDLSSLFGTFNAANQLDPGDAVTGLDLGADTGTTAAASDPLAFLGL